MKNKFAAISSLITLSVLMLASVRSAFGFESKADTEAEVTSSDRFWNYPCDRNFRVNQRCGAIDFPISETEIELANP